MAALRRGGRELRRHRRRDGAHLRADVGRRRPDPARRRDRDERRRQRRRALGADDGGGPGRAREHRGADGVRHGARRRHAHGPPGAPGPGRPTSPTPTSGCAATPTAPAAPRSAARPARPTRRPRRDVGHVLRVVVTATNAAGTRSETSDATGAVDAVAPAVRTAPSVDGTIRDGDTLVADPGTWDGTQPIAFAYQWRRCDAAGDACTTITGATGRTYTATADDVGGTLRVAVTASNRGGADTATSAPIGRVAASAPVNTAAPQVEGAPRDGQTLTADPGTWGGTAPVSFTYQWRRCDATGADCRDIDGATDAAYAATPDDVEHAVLVLVTAHNDGGTQTAVSAPTAAVAAQAPQNTATPGVSGPVADGGTLTADAGDWTGTPDITFTYRWERCDAQGAECAAVTGATGRTYDLNGEEIGHTLRVAVTAHNAGGTATATSATTAPVAPVAPRTSDGPTVTGDERAGATLTADAGTWTGTQPITLAYRWQRCDGACADIPGADGTTYDTVAEDVGATVRVVVTATNAAGTAQRRVRRPRADPRRPADEHRASDDHRHRRRRRDADRRAGDLERDAADRLRLPLAALRHRRGELRRDPRRGRADLPPDGGRRRPHDPRRRDRDEPRRPRDRVVGRDRHGAARRRRRTRPAVGLRHGARRRDADRRHGRVDRHRAARVQLPLAALRRERRLPHHRRRDRRDVHRDVGGRPQHAAGRRHGDQRRRVGERRLAADRGRGGGPARQHDRAVDRRRRACRRAARRRSRRLDRHRAADVRVRVAALRRPRRVVRPDRGRDRRQLRARRPPTRAGRCASS